jgi:hypothetical protein
MNDRVIEEVTHHTVVKGVPDPKPKVRLTKEGVLLAEKIQLRIPF